MRHVEDQEGNPWHNDAKRIEELSSGVGAHGVHACQPFQCPLCWMRNLESRNPGPGDEAYMRTIKRATLDAICGISRSTVAGHRGRINQLVINAERIGKTPTLEPRGPFPLKDSMGMGLAVDILQKSVHAKGRNEAVVQAITFRQLRGTYTKSYESSPAGVAEGGAFSKGTGRTRPTSCVTQSDWYQAFWIGLERRMGYKSKSNHALSIAAMVHTIGLMEEAALDADTQEESNHLWKVSAYLTLCTSGGLRGNEGFYLDLAALVSYSNTGREGAVPENLTRNKILSEEECQALPHVVCPLLGKFKGSHNVDHHFINLAHESVSGLRLRKSMDQLVDVARLEGRRHGPAFASADGTLASSSEYNETFKLFLKRTQDATSLISEKNDVETMYGTARTPRKTLTSRAKRAGFGEELDEMNRWSGVEAARNKRPNQKMNVLYADAVLMMPVTWRLSHAL
jgi:hypothetical protein